MSEIPEVVYVPGGGDVDQAVRLGAAWLREHTGDRLVLVPQKQVYRNNALLPELTAGAKVAKPQTVWQVGWRGGPVLAPWPTGEVLSEISDHLSKRITAVCLLEWGEDEYLRAWVRAQNGTNLLTGDAAPGEEELLSPVVTAAMEDMSRIVNHANGLVQQFDKEYAIQTLQRLVRAGYTFDVDNLVAWALAHGFTGSEVTRLRDYATKVLRGHRFRLTGRPMLVDNVVELWEQEARQR
jgi:hypothetical protein